MDFLDLVTEVIDLRSFSNLWYWIVLAILWSTLSHWVMGVPYHMINRARQGDDQSLADVDQLARISVRRILAAVDVSGAFMAAFTAFLASGLFVLGWGYHVEFCQALFLLFFPMILVGVLTVYTARRLQARDFDDVPKALRMHRMMVQGLGVVFIFVTAFWGMWTNVNVGPLG